jgi:hypothetical protein
MTTQPNLRVGNTEREAVAEELREHFAHGRLTLDELNQRLDATFAAKTQADLDAVTADLPHARSYGGPLPASRAGGSRYHYSGGSSGGTHGACAGGRPPFSGGRRLAGFTTLLVLLASCLIVFDAMAGLHIPGFGRLGILIAIFGLLRGLVRRIFGWGRRRL